MYDSEGLSDCEMIKYHQLSSGSLEQDQADTLLENQDAKMDSYLYSSIEDDFLDFYDPMDYSDTLDSPCSNDSDQENSQTHFHFSSKKCGGKSPVKKVQQRKAANMRERRRMKSINEAFDSLRSCIPAAVTSDRRLSKVDTLKLAMRYISYLSDVVQSTNDFTENNHFSPTDRQQEKVILRCRFSADLDPNDTESYTLLGHSLSWVDDKLPKTTPDNKLTAKLWVPENATEADILNLSNYTADYTM